MLNETLGVRRPAQLSTAGIVFSDGFQIFIHAVMRPQPFALAGMTGEHRKFFFMRRGDVDQRGGWHRPAEWINALHRIAIVKPRHTGIFRQGK